MIKIKVEIRIDNQLSTAFSIGNFTPQISSTTGEATSSTSFFSGNSTADALTRLSEVYI